jgi:tetratricopeptide (TPR) repeat protein
MSRFTCLACVLLLAPSFAHAEEPLLTSPGMPDWQKGQQAMLDGETEKAISLFQQSLKQDPDLIRNRLSLAAAYLAVGEEKQAAEQLERYLDVKPEHFLVRGQYAELLWRLDRLESAREQFERFDADIQDCETPAQQQLVHCHSRLMDIASRTEDDYARHLHRGIALYWLARQSSETIGAEDELPSEGLFCQSASELVQARRARPEEARPSWYLYEVWSQLGQKQPATRWLRIASEYAPLSYLTPAEQRGLHFARRRQIETALRR